MCRTLFYIVLLAVICLVSNDPFFWDTVQLASKHGHYFYGTDFQSLILPEELDSGHPPIFGMYIAMVWKLFGKTLVVSHFAMLPFLFGIVFFLQKIGERLLGKKAAPWLLLICFADPVLAGQSVLVSPDLALVCFFLMATWAIWSEKKWLLAIAVVGLGLISMRGMMVGAALYVFSIFVAKERVSPSLFLKKILPFLPGGLLAASYLFFHWSKTGWVGYHPGSTWAPSFERVDFHGFIKNLAVLVWRFLDFGRVFVWLTVVALAIYLLKKKGWKWDKPNRHEIGWQIVALTLFLFLATVPSQLFYKGLLAHRYLLPVFISLNFGAVYLLLHSKFEAKLKRIAVPLMGVALALGNFWVYPQRIAMGWDSTLAHLPWHGLLKQSEVFIKTAGIPYENVGTAFPNIGSRELYELNGVKEGFIEKDLATNCFVLYSNIMNDFTDAELDMLQSNWEVLFERSEAGVFVILYKNPNQTVCAN